MRTRMVSIVLVVLGIALYGSCTRGGTQESGSSDEQVGSIPTATRISMPVKISPQQAKQMMEDGSVVVVDVRTEVEFKQGHIPGAVLVPNESISSVDMPAELPDASAVLLVYCRSGNRSAQASRKLVALGYKHVYDFGGINDWPYETTK